MIYISDDGDNSLGSRWDKFGFRASGIQATSAGGMVGIHDRRPVVLAPELAPEWLDLDKPKERAEQMAMQQGDPSETFEWFKVDPAVGNVRNQGPALIEQV